RIKQYSLLAVALLLALGIFTLYTPDISAEKIEQKYTNNASKFMEVDGLRIHYRDEGAGPALVLIHGSNASLHTWEGWVDELSSDFRIISLDMPGHGLTGPDPEQRYDWISMANLVDSFLVKLDVSTFSIAGNSMGGAVAWNYTLMHPSKVEKLILIDSRGYPSEEPKPAVFKAFATPIIGHILTKVTPRSAIEASMNDVYGDSSKVTKEIVTRSLDLTLRAGNREATRVRFSEPSYDQNLAQIDSINAPTLIMWGEKDTWILPKYAQRFLADIKNSTLKLYENDGHLPMEESPVQTAKDAHDFLMDGGSR
ncbi:MAG: alpha/beta hydrolase, partial [Parvibaculaceae bacterium]|nr:alpha/beta hydrolase [Parvibaculaceae bacterium]